MILDLDPSNRIVGTEYAWELQRRYVSAGKSTWRAYRWFPSLTLALQDAAHRKIRTADVQGVAEAIKRVDSVVQRFERLIDEPLERLAQQAARLEHKLRVVK